MAERSLLKKIQDQPEPTRKIIFWLLVIVLGILFFLAWVCLIRQRVAGFDQEKLDQDMRLPQLEDRLKDMPSLEIPKIDDSQLKELEKLLKEEPSQ